GSGAGIKQFTGKQVDFAGSDSALKTDEAAAAKTSCGSDAWNLPMVAGPIAVAYNVKGVSNLVLNADVIAKIFNGVVTTWNDPAITALNSGATLPATPIKIFFRSDESGTTENFTNYLKAAAPSAWTAAPGKKWTGKGEGKEKSAGVSSAVASTDGGITYTEWSYATQNKLAMAKIDTGSGTPVELNGTTAGQMVATATQVGTGNDLSLKLDYATKAPGTYPIVLVTYNIVCSKYADSAKGTAVKGFFSSFASDATQSGLEELGYAPLPKQVQAKVIAAVNAVS
ncbi:MAG TPA: phosphate ABC transporter substrate-binding protein PstS, partial [Lapillicoccus sp.]|nr:phosphate ABC transporter substrate-binding protein PstS [Lapillicoccus sp.]